MPSPTGAKAWSLPPEWKKLNSSNPIWFHVQQHLYDVPIEEGKVEVRCGFDVSDKLGLDGPGAPFDSVSFTVNLQSPAPPEHVKKLIEHARRGCHAEQSFRKPIPVTALAKLNGRELEL